MGKINVAFDGKPLFNWEGTTEELDHMEAPLKEVADKGNITVDVLTQSAVVLIAKRGGFFSSNQEFEMMMATYFVLNCPIYHPDHPGRYCDYLSAWNFDFNIHNLDETEGQFSMEVEGTLDGIKQVWPRIN